MIHMKSNTKNVVAIIVTAVLAALRGSKNGVEMPPASGASVHFGEANVMMTAASLRKLGRAIYQAMRQGKAGLTNLPPHATAQNPVPRQPEDLAKAKAMPARKSDADIAKCLQADAYGDGRYDVISVHLYRQASKPRKATAKAATRQAGKTAKPTRKVVDGHARFTAIEAQQELIRRWMKKQFGIIMPYPKNRAVFNAPKKALEAACLAGGLALPQ